MIDLYTKPDCLLCEEVQMTLELLQKVYSFQINICNIQERDDWLEQYFLHIPVIDIEGDIIYGEQTEWNYIERKIQSKINN